jgi:molybdate transport system substrate-binding protein
VRRLASWALALAVLAGCATGCAAAGGEASGDGGAGGSRTLDVLAAASLTGTFEALADEFEDAHPEVEVRLSFGSSAALAQQLLEGAPADVLATADLATMQTAEDGGAVADPTVFATNRMVLVTSADGATPIRDIGDLEDEEVTFVTCVESAPCGAVAARLLAANDVDTPPVSLEADVRAVLAKVLSREVDAGLVYVTDAESAAADARSLPVPGSAEQLTSYAVAVTTEADDREAAEQWVSLVTGDRGRQLLDDAGFGPAAR